MQRITVVTGLTARTALSLVGVVSVFGLATACGGSGKDGGVTAPPPPAKAAVVFRSASATTNADYTDRVVVGVANTGGAGTFYIEFWGQAAISTTPTGCKVVDGQTGCPPPPQVYMGRSESVTVTAGYSETLAYDIPARVSSVRALTQPVNTAVYTQTDCRTVRATGSC